MLSTQFRKPRLDLADALIDGTLIRAIHVLRDHLIQTCRQLREIATQVLA